MLQGLTAPLIRAIVLCVLSKITFSIKTKYSFYLNAVPSPVERAREKCTDSIKLKLSC
jgi:hypothetical protein